MTDSPLNKPVILVDDEEHILNSLSLFLRSHGIKKVITISDGRELTGTIEQGGASVIVLDLTMPFISGIDLLPILKDRYPEIPVLVVTASQELDTAINCMKLGAFDYLVKPVEKTHFLSSVSRAKEIRELKLQIGSLKKHLLQDLLTHDEAFAHIVTNSVKMKSLFQYMEAISGSSEPVLISGETGVGKELFAKAIHQLSQRPGELVAVNVAGLDDNMFSDTLFGHGRGAFTGATQSREGFIAKAGKGTLFLDEIGDLTITSQIKLLRLLQENVYYPLGSDIPKNNQANIILATNRNLRELMDQELFRADLFYRLSAHQIDIPPLRERSEDIPLLVAHFMDEACNSMNKPPVEPSPEFLQLLGTYHFPGNVRELRGMLYDTVARHSSGNIASMEPIRNAIVTSRNFDRSPGVENMIQGRINIIGNFPTLKEAEELLVREALKQAGQNQGIAATLLGISRPALNRRLKNIKSDG